jgi:hypothetical protein
VQLRAFATKETVKAEQTRCDKTIHGVEAMCWTDMVAQASTKEAIPVRRRGDAHRIGRLGGIRRRLSSPRCVQEEARGHGGDFRLPLIISLNAAGTIRPRITVTGAALADLSPGPTGRHLFFNKRERKQWRAATLGGGFGSQ